MLNMPGARNLQLGVKNRVFVLDQICGSLASSRSCCMLNMLNAYILCRCRWAV